MTQPESWALSPQYGSLIVSADGTKADDCPTPRLNSIMQRLAIPGFSEGNGRESNLSLMANYRAAIVIPAADAAWRLKLAETGA